MFEISKTKPLEIFLMRHGELEGVSWGQYYGHTDYSLSERGRAQAEKSGTRLLSENFEAVYVSTLSRAKETMEIVRRCARIDLSPIEDARLCEMDFGSVEGFTHSQILNEHPELAEKMNADWLNCEFPGGESPKRFSQRVENFYADLIKYHPDGGKVLIVAHGGTIRVALCNLLGLSEDFFWRFKCEYASISKVDILDGYGVLDYLNVF